MKDPQQEECLVVGLVHCLAQVAYLDRWMASHCTIQLRGSENRAIKEQTDRRTLVRFIAIHGTALEARNRSFPHLKE